MTPGIKTLGKATNVLRLIVKPCKLAGFYQDEAPVKQSHL